MASPTNTPQQPSALALKRMELPNKPSQGWIANQVSDRIGEVVGQQAVSYWENGKVNLKNVHPRKLKAYAEVLRISLQELADAAGYDLVELFPEEAPKPSAAFTASARGYRVPRPPRPTLPDSLIDAGRIYGDKPGFEGVREPRWQYHMAGLPHRRRPQTPEEWLALYIDLRDRYDPPEVEE